jgi:alpha-D-xyloside xylohydrolase
LMPYTYSLAWMTTSSDYTPMRMLVFDFRTDPKVKNIGNQYMYGPAFMVSPVTAYGATSRSVYLPAGKWFDFWTGATVTGGASITAQAPLSQIPLHIRAGSIVPMGPDVQYATERADTIELRVYPGADGSFIMYEDEGDNYNYETGTYATIPISYVDNPRKVTIGARTGSFTGMDAKKIFNIVYVSPDHGTGVGKTQTPDVQIIYNGATGLVQPRTSLAVMIPAQKTIRTAGNKVTLPNALFETMKSVSVYDCSGRLLKTATVKKNEIDMRKDFGLPLGIYLLKVKMRR